MKREFTDKDIERVSPFDLFIVAITVLSVINLLLYLVVSNVNLLYVIAMIDFLLSAIFLVDFIRLFRKAEHKAEYFFRGFGWADLLASLPFPQFKILRIFRLFKAAVIIRRIGPQRLGRQLAAQQASLAIFTVFFLIILLLEFGSVGILAIEGSDPSSNIKTASDAIWWVYVTITTVGYGDYYPVTNAGRLLGMVVMLVGVGLFGVVTGFLANKFLPERGSSKSDSPDSDEVVQLRAEIRQIKELLEKNNKTT